MFEPCVSEGGFNLEQKLSVKAFMFKTITFAILPMRTNCTNCHSFQIIIAVSLVEQNMKQEETITRDLQQTCSKAAVIKLSGNRFLKSRLC